MVLFPSHAYMFVPCFPAYLPMYRYLLLLDCIYIVSRVVRVTSSRDIKTIDDLTVPRSCHTSTCHACT